MGSAVISGLAYQQVSKYVSLVFFPGNNKQWLRVVRYSIGQHHTNLQPVPRSGRQHHSYPGAHGRSGWKCNESVSHGVDRSRLTAAARPSEYERPRPGEQAAKKLGFVSGIASQAAEKFQSRPLWGRARVYSCRSVVANVSALQRPRCAFCGATSFSAACFSRRRAAELSRLLFPQAVQRYREFFRIRRPLSRVRKNSILFLLLGGAAVHRCDNRLILMTALAAEVTFCAGTIFPRPFRAGHRDSTFSATC